MPNIVNLDIDDQGVATITLNRPEAANAMSLELLNALQEIIQSVTYDPAVRCVVLTAAGEKVFCAGADLKERASMDAAQTRQAVALIRDTVSRIENLPQPVIAVLNGSALGGGLELALACDIRIGADHIKVGLPETSLAIIPGAGGTQRLPRLIGSAKAKELIFTAQKLTAHEALQMQLLEHIVPLDQLTEKRKEITDLICQNGPVALQQAKFAIDKGAETDLQTGLSIEQKAYEITIPTEDRREGLQAFKEKRKPHYKGR